MNAEIAHATFRLLLQVHSKEGAQIPEPLRIRRPGTVDAETLEEAPPRMATSEEMAAFFGPGAVHYVGPPTGGDG